MTFSEFIIQLRYRLQDIRKADTSVITLATDDGIRWSSLVLQTIAKGAITEMLRTLSALKLNEYINTAIQFQVLPISINVEGGVEGLPDAYNKILSIIDEDNNTYEFISQEKFFTNEYMSLDEENGIGNTTNKYFTVFYNFNNEGSTPIVKTNTTELKSGKAVIKVPLTELYTITNASPLPFVDVDDLLLDIAEKEARNYEVNSPRADALNKNIDRKLQELTLELQRTDQ